jgi:hypothetical protein
LYTAALPQDTLNAYNLQSNDTPFASDHLPLIADFTLNKIVSTVDVFDEVNGTHIVNVSPNPVLQDADIQVFIKGKEQVELTVWNTIGQQVLTVFNDEKEEGTHIFKMETNDLPTGTYIVQLKTETAVIAKKIQVVK